MVGSILLPTLDVKPERNGPWPTTSGPKPICLGQWPSKKQRSWWEPQGIRRWVHQQRGPELCPLSLQPRGRTPRPLSLQPGGRTSHWTQGGVTPPSWLPGRPPNRHRTQTQADGCKANYSGYTGASTDPMVEEGTSSATGASMDPMTEEGTPSATGASMDGGPLCIEVADKQAVTSDQETRPTGTPSAWKGEGSDKQKAPRNSSMGEERPIERTKSPCRQKMMTKKGTGAAAPRPIFCDHPVIVEDLMQAGPARLRSLDWKMAKILKAAVGAVRTIRPISANKIVVGCDSSQQQSRLTRLTKISQTGVRCSVPQPKVEGVVRGIPHIVPLGRISQESGARLKRARPNPLQGEGSLPPHRTEAPTTVVKDSPGNCKANPNGERKMYVRGTKMPVWNRYFSAPRPHGLHSPCTESVLCGTSE